MKNLIHNTPGRFNAVAPRKRKVHRAGAVGSILLVGLLFGLIAIPGGQSYASLSSLAEIKSLFTADVKGATLNQDVSDSDKNNIVEKRKLAVAESEEAILWTLIKKHSYEERVPPKLLAAIAHVNKTKMKDFKYSDKRVGVFNLSETHFKRAALGKSNDLDRQTKIAAVNLRKLLKSYRGNKHRAVAAYHLGTRLVPKDRTLPLRKKIRPIVDSVMQKESQL